MKYLKYTLITFLLVGSSLLAQGQMEDNALETYLREHQIEATAAAHGMYYQVTQEGSGNYPQAGDYIQIRYIGKLLDGKVFDQSKEEGPVVFQLGGRQVISGWELGIPLFREGAKGILYLPAKLAYGKRGAGEVVPPNAPLIFEIELADIMDIDAYDRYMDAQDAKEQAAFKQRQVTQFTEDKNLIKDYIRQNKLKAKQTASGLTYVITKKGKGKMTAQAGDILEVQYEGFLLDGQPFDASAQMKPYRFTLGKGKVIKGWEEGLQYFKKGGEGWLLIPSKLAYGPRPIIEENVRVPANSVLVFKIKVVNLERGGRE